MSINIGDSVPNFSLESSEGTTFSLDKYKGKKVVLYFYPKDNTPGCTMEAIEFTENLQKFSELNAVVFGISKDDIACHGRFIEKHSLSVPLLSDTDKKIHEMFGVWLLKKMFGKESYGTVRSTFIIDENGVLIKEYRKVKASGHAEKVLEYLKSI